MSCTPTTATADDSDEDSVWHDIAHHGDDHNYLYLIIFIVCLCCCFFCCFAVGRHLGMDGAANDATEDFSEDYQGVGQGVELFGLGGSVTKTSMKVVLVQVDDILKNFSLERLKDKKTDRKHFKDLFDFNDPLLEALGQIKFQCDKISIDLICILVDKDEFQNIGADHKKWRRVIKTHKIPGSEQNIDVEVYVKDYQSQWTDPTCIRTDEWVELEYLDKNEQRKWLYEKQNPSMADNSTSSKTCEKQTTPPAGFSKTAKREKFGLQLRLAWEGVATEEIKGSMEKPSAHCILEALTEKYQHVIQNADITYVGAKACFNIFKKEWDEAAGELKKATEIKDIRYTETCIGDSYEDILSVLQTELGLN